jgi:hypothetical protein
MDWSIICEAGIGPAPMPTTGYENKLLHHPIFAEQFDGGTYRIVDELGREKQVPFSFKCRRVSVDADGNVLYDSLDIGIDAGYGCLMENGSMAILLHTKWELLIVSPESAIMKIL